MRVAIVCSAHGFGHVARQMALVEVLRAQGDEVEVFAAAALGPAVRHWVVDVGIAQRDSRTEDVAATLPLLEERCGDTAIDALAACLAGFERVVVDVAPAGLEAARRAGVPAFAVGNFDWAWIYGHYPPLHAWAERFVAWQAPHPGLVLWPGPGLAGFAHVEPVGLLAREAAPVRVAERAVLVCFGGFGLDGLDALLPRVPGITWVLAPPVARLDRPDCLYVEDVPFPSLVAGADVVFTKPGYGIFAECAAAGVPIAWLSRGAFPEAPFLEAAMAARGDYEVRDGLGAAARIGGPLPPPVRPDAAHRIAARLVLGPT